MKAYSASKDNLISVVVPVYNVGQFLSRCITSITQQTYRNLQIILVDDGSTDNSGVICDEFSKKDARIEVFHKTNEGVAVARNVGINMAKGKFLCFIDSDDWLAHNYIEIMYKKIAYHSADVVICGWYKASFKEGKLVSQVTYNQALGNRVIDNRKRMLKYVINPILHNNQKRTAGFYSTCNKLYNLQLLKDFPIRFIPGFVHEDYYFNLEVFSRSTKIVGIKQCLYFYFIELGRFSLSRRIHAGIGFLEARNDYFTKYFSEIASKRNYAKEVYKWFIAHRKNIINSQINEEEKERRIKELDNSELYKWVLTKTGYSKKRIISIVNRDLKIIRLKEKIKGFINKANVKN